MCKKELESLFANIKLPKDIQQRLERVCQTPEGDVEARWVHKLLTYYLYSVEQLALQVPAGAGRNAASSAVFADIVVYRDRQKREPFIVVEVKKKGTNEAKGIKQAESYARNLGAEYHVWSDWLNSKFFKTARYIDQSTAVGNIPTWAFGNESNEYLSKEHVLIPFPTLSTILRAGRQGAGTAARLWITRRPNARLGLGL